MKRILIPTDFSENAKKAAEYAIRLFIDEAEFTLIHTYQIPHSGAQVLISIQDILAKDAKDLLDEEFERLIKIFPQVASKIKLEVRLGDPPEVLKKLSSEGQIDLVAMGTQGATGITAALVGSVTTRVMEMVHVPILAIPLEAELRMPSSIAFAADDTSLNELQLPKFVSDFAQKCAADLHVINVIGKEEAKTVGNGDLSTATPIDSLEGLNCNYHFVQDEDVLHGIDEFLQNHSTDLLVLINRKKDLFSMLFNRSVTKRMLLHSKTPLLSIPE